MEIWYTLAGDITIESTREAINWITGQFYNSKISKIKFFISSNGGDIDSGTRLYDYLKAVPAEVETYGFGQVDSAAILVFLAGRKRYAVKNCRFRIHEGSYRSQKGYTSLNIHSETLNFLKELARRSTEIISKEVNKSFDEVEKVKQAGKILSTKEAKDFKLIHKVIDKLPLEKEKVAAK